jgi:hypothetical protein
MMFYVPFEGLTNRHIQMIDKSLKSAPLFGRPSLEAVIRKLREKDTLLFEVPRGIILAEVLESGGERRLCIPAFYCEKFGAHSRGISANVIRLALDWNCSKIETCVYSRAMLGILKRSGARVESINMVMQLEPDHGQQENINHHAELDAKQRSS